VTGISRDLLKNQGVDASKKFGLGMACVAGRVLGSKAINIRDKAVVNSFECGMRE
jgi:hypothetical protein